MVCRAPPHSNWKLLQFLAPISLAPLCVPGKLPNLPQMNQSAQPVRAGNRAQSLRALGFLLIAAGLLTIAAIALLTLRARRSAVAEAEESAKVPDRPEDIAIGLEKGETEWRVFVSSDNDRDIGPDEQLTYLFDDGTIVRVRGHMVIAFLSRGYWKDLATGSRRVWGIVALVVLTVGVGLVFRRPVGAPNPPPDSGAPADRALGT